MLRSLPFRRSCACVMGASLLVSASAPAVSTYPKPRGGDTTLEVYSNDGKLVRRYEGHEIPAVARPLSRPKETVAGPSLPEAAAQLRAAVLRLQKSSSRHKPDLSMTLAVADAMSATSGAEAHRILAKLPIRIERTAATGGSDGLFVTTSVYVRGTLKLRMTKSVASRGSDEQFSGPALGAQLSGPFAAEGDLSLASPGPSERAAEFTCDEDPNDPCADEQDRDDALAGAAALQADLDAASASASSDEADCSALGLCYIENVGGSLSGDPAASALASAAPADELSNAYAFDTALSSAAGAYSLSFNCGVEYIAAASGILWAASGILGLAAIAASPEPVSKLGLWAAWTNAAAGVTAAIAGVGFAYHCWAT